MSKHALLLLAGIAGLHSCTPPPPVPPPRFRPNPPHAPIPVQPDAYGNDIAPPQIEPIPEPPAPTATGGYPTGRATNNPNEVVSPYEPFNVIDVAGFTSGQLVRDPSNKKIFRVP